MADREDNVFKATLADQLDRYDDMLETMMKVASLDFELNYEERNLLSSAYKNAIGARRASWRIIRSIEKKEEIEGDKWRLEVIKNYRGQFETELKDICQNILVVLDLNLIPRASTAESKVFYYNMKGDLHRFLAEFATGDTLEEASENGLKAYAAASDIAMDELPPSDPLRLSLALHYSVFHYEILNSPSRACRLARQALDDAKPELGNLSKEKYGDSVLTMQVLQDNVAFWTSEMDRDEMGNKAKSTKSRKAKRK